MLNSDQARDALAQFVIDVDDSTNRWDLPLPRVKKLPKKLREIGFLLLNKGLNGKKPPTEKGNQAAYQRFKTAYEKRRETFSSFSLADKKKLLTALCGAAGDAIACAIHWEIEQRFVTGTVLRRAKADPNDFTDELIIAAVQLGRFLEPETPTAEWLAAWASHLGKNLGGGHRNSLNAWYLTSIFASVISRPDAESDRVFDILCDTIRGEHETCVYDQHVVPSLLAGTRPEGWELVGKTLLAAQRQEGLRDDILQSLRVAQPEALRYIFDLCNEHKLTRFTSVWGALANLFGFFTVDQGGMVHNMTPKQIRACLEHACEMLDTADPAKVAAQETDAERLWFALWATGCANVDLAWKTAASRLDDVDDAIRFVVVQFLRFSEAPLADKVAPLVTDGHRQVADAAYWLVCTDVAWGGSKLSKFKQENRFDAIEAYLEQVPKNSYTLDPIVWSWTGWTVNPDHTFYTLFRCLGDLPPTRLLPHLDRLDTYRRCEVITLLAAQKKWSNETRDSLRCLATDRSTDVAVAAVRELIGKGVSSEEVDLLEGLLTRSAAGLRTTVFDALTSLPQDGPLESAERLLASGKAPQRLGGLEVLRQLNEADRFNGRPREIAAGYASLKKRINKQEQIQLDAILSEDDAQDDSATVFGLVDEARLVQPVAPKNHKVKLVTPATTRLIQALDDLIHSHQKTEYTSREGTICILGEQNYGFYFDSNAKTVANIKASMPLADVWLAWNRKRPKATRDADGHELLRAAAYLDVLNHSDRYYGNNVRDWCEAAGAKTQKLVFGPNQPKKLRHKAQVTSVLDFLVMLSCEAEPGFEFSVQAWETLLNSVDLVNYVEQWQKKFAKATTPWEVTQLQEDIWQSGSPIVWWKDLAFRYVDVLPKTKRKAALARLFPIAHWADTVDGTNRSGGSASAITFAAYAASVIAIDDVLKQAVTPVFCQYRGRAFERLSELTNPSARDVPRDQKLMVRVDELVGRIVETELNRGEAATDAASLASAVKSVPGTDRLLALIGGLDKKGYARTSYYYNETLSRRESLTKLIKSSRPRPTDTPDDFAKQVKACLKANEFPEDRILQLAFLAPQWVAHVEAYFRWDGFSEAVYWFMAHMRGWGMGDKTEAAAEAAGYEAEQVADDADWKTRQAAKSGWERLIGERTPISKEDRDEGAIDVAWFEAVSKRVKPARWERLAEAARFADNAQQAKRAKFVGDTLAGKADRKKLISDIAEKRLKDSVRLFGLMPLAKGTRRHKDVLERYAVLSEYQKYARTLSGLTRPDAERAVNIGMDNLARQAGYADPLRMHWALEAESTADLIGKPIVVAEGDASYTFELDDQALPVTTIRRGERELKSLPKELKKHPRIVELRERAKQLKQLNTRSRRALEEAMIRGDEFTGAELRELADHAVVWPMVSRLVLLGEGIAGYPDKKGKTLRSHDGSLEPVKARESLRIAHPHDLLTRKDWSQWQRECLMAERVQPFKQVFRELYPLTAAEKKGGGTKQGRRANDHVSRRYTGQQVQPSQALALFGSRGWCTNEGVWKTDHNEKITAEVYADLYYGSVAELELPTIDGVVFRRVGQWDALPLHEVPPRLFSEIMRDVDLAVSVAHAGGVDPEATASTVEMRASLLQETCALLKLKNVKVELKKVRAFIQGHFGEYTVHLGSGTVHRLPGGAVCLVPVHSQHRGRLFLPFADDDPRTAEVMSKVLLLARDKEIKDTVLLEQLRG